MKEILKSKILFFLLGTFFWFGSCNYENYSNSELQLTTDPLVTEAREFFEINFYPNNEMLCEVLNEKGNKSKRHFLQKCLDWDKAYTKALSNGQTGVYVPVNFNEDLYLKSPWSSFSLNMLTYALIYEGKKGKKSVEIITTFPSPSYLAAKVQPEFFTGVVYVEDWKGDLIKSINYTNGRPRLYNANEVKTKTKTTYCETIIDWYSCGYVYGGNTMTCHFMATEIVFGICDNGSGAGSAEHTVIFDYEPATPIGAGGNNSAGTPDDKPQVCDDGYIKNAKGECIRIVEPCVTDDEILNSLNIQESFKNIWDLSKAIDTSVPMADRREAGGWIVNNNGVYSFIPYPDHWISTPCGIEVPLGINWMDDFPRNAVAWVHTHPFHIGEDNTSVCGEERGEKSFTGGASDEDKASLNAYWEKTGKALNGYVMDGNNIYKYDIKSSYINNVKRYTRCGY